MKQSLFTLTLLGSSLLATNLSARPAHRPTPPEPETVVVEMMTNYDADESDSLTATELAAAFKGLREMHRDAAKGERPLWEKRGGPPNPEGMATKLVEQFDTTGDEALNTEELLAAIEFIHSRPMGKRGGPRPNASE